jgi:hypothetical protein
MDNDCTRNYSRGQLPALIRKARRSSAKMLAAVASLEESVRAFQAEEACPPTPRNDR